MKKYIGFIMLAGLVLSFSPALAKDNEGMSDSERPSVSDFKEKREAFREKMESERKTFYDQLKKNREAFLAEVRTKKEEWKSATIERMRQFWNNAKDMLGRRFEMAVNSLEKLQERVGNVIDKLESDGKDTTDATAALDLSKEKLEDAKGKLAEIKELLPKETGETITPEVFEKIKLLAREAKDLLKESKENLREAIAAIKIIREEDKNED